MVHYCHLWQWRVGDDRVMNYLAEPNELSSEALLTNLTIRNKLLLDLLPLALMVIVAGLYSSIDKKRSTHCIAT